MMSTFGQRLRLLRDEKKMVQKEIADLLDVSQSTIGKYEGDQRTPSPDAIIKLAVFFEVSTDYLLGHSEIRNPLCPEYLGLPEEAIREIEDYKKYIKFKYGNEKIH
jgi:transcriptional regulator with XRE-family HTH domain